MKVLNIMSRFNVGGTSQWLYQLSRGLDNQNISNLLLIGDCPDGEREDDGLANLKHRRITGLGPKTSALQTLKAIRQLRREIKNFDPDIINTHTSKAGVLGRIAAKSSGSKAKVVHTYHGHVLHGYFNPIFQSLIRFIEITLSLITDLFLVSGEQVLQDLRQAGIIRSKPVLTIWPAVPDLTPGDRKELRKSLGIPNDAVVFGWLGRKVPIKRIDRIVELARSRPSHYFVIAGDGEEVKIPGSNYSAEGLGNLVELGFTSPSSIWAISDICLLTSDNEAMPISPIEAALCGKPVIATDAGSTREVVIQGETGFVCQKDVKELLAYVDLLASDKALRAKLGDEARKFALAKFSTQSSIERQIVGYKQALSV